MPRCGSGRWRTATAAMTSRRCSARFGLTSRSADLAICHIETPMSPRPPQGYPVFNTPTQLAHGDQADRLADLRHGVQPFGRSGAIWHRPDRLGARSRRGAAHRVVRLARSTGPDADRDRQGREGGISCLHRDDEWDPASASVVGEHRECRRGPPRGAMARRRGAQVVIVNFHWGTEFQAAPSAFQLDTARALATDPRHHRDRRPARTCRAADQARRRQAGRVRGRSAALQPVGRLLPGADRGRNARVSAHHR